MEISLIRSLFSPHKPIFWLFTLGVFSLFTTLSFILELSPYLAPAFVIVLLALAFLSKPLALLGILLFIRMSLDQVSQTARLTLNENISLSLSQCLGLFLTGISIGLLIIYRNEIRHFILWRPLCLLIAFGVFSLFFSIAPFTTLQEIARLLSILAIGFLAFIAVSRPSDVKKILWLLLASSALPLLTALYQLAFGIGMADSSIEVSRIYGTFAHPNVLAIYLYSMGAVAALLYFWPRETAQEVYPERFWLLAYALMVGGLLIVTYTRVAWIAAFLFVFFIALWRYRLLLFPLIALPLILIMTFVPFRERVTESFETRPDSSIVWRLDIWGDVTGKLALDDKTLLGTGLDTFTLYAESLRGIRFGSNDAHNDFVKFYVEGGYLGLFVFFAYIGLLALALRSLFQLPTEYRPLALLFTFYSVTLLLSSLSDNIYKDTPIQWVLFILFGALLGLRKVLPQKN